MKNKVLLFNPRSGTHYRAIPNSILQVAASIEGKYEYVIVDGNREQDSWKRIMDHLDTGEFKYFASTVMPGPQLLQAIPHTKDVRTNYPYLKIIWGGYFGSSQFKVILESGYVDYVVDGPGDNTFPELLDSLESDSQVSMIKNLIFKDVDGQIIKTAREALVDQDTLPPLPYESLNKFYSLSGYLGNTFLGKRTFAYHSSLGCPFTCSFCGVVPIYNARWKGKSAGKIFEDVKYFKEQYQVDAVMFHDNNFFVSEKRVVEFAKLMKGEGINWWGEARIDTMDKYTDESLELIRESGCKMIFFGAESGSDDLLSKMDKGGKQNSNQIKAFAARLGKFDIIPEYSFVLGFPAETKKKVRQQIEDEITFIKELKEINPAMEIIIYVYSPVPTEGSELYKEAQSRGFVYPDKLEDWIKPEWQDLDIRKKQLTPWLTQSMIRRIRNFETVLNAYHPTVSDHKLTRIQNKTLRLLSKHRYRWGLYWFPYDLKILQKFWLKYTQPEVEGFYSEYTN